MSPYSSSVEKNCKNTNLSERVVNYRDVDRKRKNTPSHLKKHLMGPNSQLQRPAIVRIMISVFKAAEEGDLQRVKILFQETGTNIRKAKNRCTLLHVAAVNNQVDVVDYLLDHISPNVINKDKQTPAHLAAMEGCVGVLKVLLKDDGFDPDLQDVWQRTYKDWLAGPLFDAILMGNESQTKELLDLGANPDYHAGSSVESLMDEEFSITTARQLALSLGNECIINMLLKADCFRDVHAIDQDRFPWLRE